MFSRYWLLTKPESRRLASDIQRVAVMADESDTSRFVFLDTARPHVYRTITYSWDDKFCSHSGRATVTATRHRIFDLASL